MQTECSILQKDLELINEGRAKPLTDGRANRIVKRTLLQVHFLSALAQACASTGEASFKEKWITWVAELKKLQDMSRAIRQNSKLSVHRPMLHRISGARIRVHGVKDSCAYSPDQFALLEKYTPYATILGSILYTSQN